MPLAQAEADKLTREDLLSGVMETIIDAGAPQLFAQLPFVEFNGSTYSFNVENAIDTGRSAQDPYGTTINSGGGSNTRHDIRAKLLVRNSDTAKIDVIGKDSDNDPRANDIQKAAKKLARDFFRQFINGRTSGDHTTFYNLKGIEEWFSVYSSYSEQVIYNTDDDTVDGTFEELSLNALNKLLSRNKGGEFDVLYVNRDTWVHIKSLLDASGGNTAEMLMLDTFGRPMLTYDGIPIVRNDAVGLGGSGTGRAFDDADADGNGNSQSNEIVVNDSSFYGFHPKDDGQTLQYDGTEYTVDNVVASDTVVVKETGVITGTTGASGSVDSQNVIYACRFGEEDGVYSPYHPNPGDDPRAGEYFGGVVGFNAQDLGLQRSEERFRTRMSWYGTIAVNDPRAIARLSHFSVS